MHGFAEHTAQLHSMRRIGPVDVVPAEDGSRQGALVNAVEFNVQGDHNTACMAVYCTSCA